jgi:gliding motility-associated-like protein
VGIEKTDYLRIFNRYGELLYETKEYRRGWDGTYRGEKQDQGTYV